MEEWNNSSSIRCRGAKVFSVSLRHCAEKNPIQILVDAICNVAPREETTRLTYGGVATHVAVDISPLRRVDLALRYLTLAIHQRSFSNVKSIEEVTAEELILAANNDPSSAAVKKKLEVERIALSAR